MDLTVRDWMVIVGVLLILAVLLVAYRRVRSERRSKVRVSMTNEVQNQSSSQDEALLWLKELPNGGARVVERGDLLRATSESRKEHAALDDGDRHSADEVNTAPEEYDDELVTGMSSNETAENLDWLEGLDAGDGSNPKQKMTDEKAVRLPLAVDPEVFMLNVVSRDAGGFRGEDILHILLACDLRFGDMNFFHRHEQEAGRGPIQFSVANMVQPGVFDIDKMEDFKTPGLVFFLTLPGPEDMMQAFDYMRETAQAVSRNLGGDVLDESRSVITKQTLEHSRQKIRDLERRMLASARAD
jgi:cell division protein ZipA